MSKEWPHIQEEYERQWVALADDEEPVGGHGASVHEAQDAARKNGHSDPIFTRMPEKNIVDVEIS